MLSKKRESGVITVYLSLILGIILSFIVSTIECARLNAVRTYFNRVLQTSMESSLCDYYLPLFENYHLFGYHLETENLDEQKERIMTQVKERMNDSLESERVPDGLVDGWTMATHNFLMCNPQLEKEELNDFIYLNNEEGEYAKNQMVAYMKYEAPMELLRQTLESKEVIEDQEKTSKVLEEKMKVESQMGDIDREVLSLVSLVDGIETNEYGIKVSKSSNTLSIQDGFIKQIVTSSPTMQSVRINNSQVYEQLQGNYVQFPEVLDELTIRAESLIAMADELNYFDPENSTKEELEEYQERVEEYEQGCDAAREIAANLTETVTQMDQSMDRALSKIESIEQKRSKLSSSYDIYLDHLEKLKGEIADEFFQELSNGKDSLESYTNSGNNRFSMIKDFNKMKETLTANQKLLKEVMANPAVPFSLEPEGFQRWLAVMNTWREKLYGLRMEGLEFDYSTFQPNSNRIDPMEFIKQLLGSKLAKLVVDPEEVSNGKISRIQLPSKESDDKDDFFHMKNKDLDVESIYSNGLSLSSWNLNCNTSSTFEELVDDLLMNAYVSEHMSNFTSDELDAGQLIHYEQEYIFSGDYEEKDSLDSMITKLLVIRTLMNSISVIFDAEKCAKAEKTAQAMVGWLPVAGLSQVVKYIILIYWAYCEAVLEVSALLHGKEVPVYTTKENFKVKYTDILKLNRTYIKDEVSKYECSSKLKLSYSEYLYVLMLFVSDRNIVLRSLDLIQENLRYEYDESFRIKNCLISYSCKASGYMKQKFLFLPFFKQHNITIDGYNIISQAAVTY
ncbi:MAG: DUF5702 domain-containing protein [Clostridiales bacterium]|nr:DUF5702 domain-containing protein [Clostridiales bacterium]